MSVDEIFESVTWLIFHVAWQQPQTYDNVTHMTKTMLHYAWIKLEWQTTQVVHRPCRKSTMTVAMWRASNKSSPLILSNSQVCGALISNYCVNVTQIAIVNT